MIRFYDIEKKIQVYPFYDICIRHTQVKKKIQVYPFYDIGIWSATSRKWIDLKLKELGVWDHPDYKISVIMDAR
jgi:hypothetical protein